MNDSLANWRDSLLDLASTDEEAHEQRHDDLDAVLGADWADDAGL